MSPQFFKSWLSQWNQIKQSAAAASKSRANYIERRSVPWDAAFPGTPRGNEASDHDVRPCPDCVITDCVRGLCRRIALDFDGGLWRILTVDLSGYVLFTLLSSLESRRMIRLFVVKHDQSASINPPWFIGFDGRNSTPHPKNVTNPGCPVSLCKPSVLWILFSRGWGWDL